MDDFNTFKMKMLTDKKQQPYKRALMFVDNSGADIVLGMLPLARELLRRGTEVAAQFSFFFSWNFHDFKKQKMNVGNFCRLFW